MSKPISFGELDFNLVASMQETRKTLETETPFHMLLMGDFSGRANRGQERTSETLKTLKPFEVDRDNLDTILADLNVEVGLPLLKDQSPLVCIPFSELDES